VRKCFARDLARSDRGRKVNPINSTSSRHIRVHGMAPFDMKRTRASRSNLDAFSIISFQRAADASGRI